MITTRYALCASRVIRDASEERISVVDLMEDIAAQAFPIVIPKLSFVWCLKRESNNDPAQFPGLVTIRLDNEQLFQHPININFQTTLINRQIVAVGGLAIPRPGKVVIIFSAEHVHDASFEFNVLAAPQANDRA